MASPVTIHASHPASHFFREHSTYSEDYSPRVLRDGGAMGQHRLHPYERRPSQSPPRSVRESRSPRFTASHLAIQQQQQHLQHHTMRSPPQPLQVMHPSHSMPSQLAASSAHPSAAASSGEGGRIAVNHLVERRPFSPPQHAGPYHSDPHQHQSNSASMASSRAVEQDAAARLPGIGSVCSNESL